MANYESYIICTSPRSGSTLLCRLLTATGIAGNPESYFHTSSLDGWRMDLGFTDQDPVSERETLAAIFDEARAQGANDTGIFGLRLQRHSFDFFLKKLEVLYPEPNNDSQRIKAAFGKTLFIHLTCKNRLEQAISYVKASQSGLWHQAPDGSELERLSAPCEPVYDADQIEQSMEELTAFDKEWESWFTMQDITPLPIIYNELSADPTGILAIILEQLGLDTKAARGINPGIAKLADMINRSWAERFLAERSSTDK
jgi:LPS sulfotransferase NodH